MIRICNLRSRPRSHQALAIALFTVSFAKAERLPVGTCDPALAQDYYQYALRDHLEEDFLEYLTADSYAQVRDSLATSGSAVIKAIPVTGSLNYEKFNELRNSYLKRQNYQRKWDEAVEILRRATPDRAYTAYEKCLDALVKADRTGLLVWTTSETPDLIQLHVKYVNTTVGPREADLKSTIGGGRVEGAPAGQLWSKKDGHWRVNEEKQFAILRDRGTSGTTVKIDPDGPPAADGLTFANRYDRADAILELSYSGALESLVKKVFATNSEERYGAGYHRLTLTTKPPRFFKNPHGNCNPNLTPCAGVGVSEPATLNDEKTSATVVMLVPPGKGEAIFLQTELWERHECGETKAIPMIVQETKAFSIPVECRPFARLTLRRLTAPQSSETFSYDWEWSPSAALHRVSPFEPKPGSPTVDVNYTLVK